MIAGPLQGVHKSSEAASVYAPVEAKSTGQTQCSEPKPRTLPELRLGPRKLLLLRHEAVDGVAGVDHVFGIIGQQVQVLSNAEIWRGSEPGRSMGEGLSIGSQKFTRKTKKTARVSIMTMIDPFTLKHSPLSRLRKYTMDPCRDASVAILTGSGESSAWSCAETEASLPEHPSIPCNQRHCTPVPRHLHHHVGALPCPLWPMSTRHYEARMLRTPEAHSTGFACSIVPNYRCAVGQPGLGVLLAPAKWIC